MLSMGAPGQAESLASWSAPRDLLIGQSYARDLESLATGTRMAGSKWPQSLCQRRIGGGHWSYRSIYDRRRQEAVSEPPSSNEYATIDNDSDRCTASTLPASAWLLLSALRVGWDSPHDVTAASNRRVTQPRLN